MDTVEYEMMIQADWEEQEAAAKLAECDRAYARERTQAAMNAHDRALQAWRKAHEGRWFAPAGRRSAGPWITTSAYLANARVLCDYLAAVRP